MRVISGEYKGRPLKAMKGNNTRPTTDRVKESLMSSIVSALDSFEGLAVLDAFAGSGGLGIEALSRQASFVVFCENNREAQRIILENLSLVKAQKQRYALIKSDVMAVPLALQKHTFDLVFLDPPYAYEAKDIFALLTNLKSQGCLSETALICYEYAKKNTKKVLEEIEHTGFVISSTKNFGDTSVSMIRKGQ